MLIEKGANYLLYNQLASIQNLSIRPIEIGGPDKTYGDTIVYFDAALSRHVVSDRTKDSRYVFIKENKDSAYFVYDPETFSKETKFAEFNNMINSQTDIKDENLDIYSGDCVCIYDPKNQTIRVYPTNETNISDNEFKII